MNKSKGETLKILKKKGFNVPDLKLISLNNYKKLNQKNFFEICKYFKGSKIAVRSSSKDEDTSKSSMAGKYNSVLNVNSNNIKAVQSAIKEVIRSYKKKSKHNQIIIQKMVRNVKYSGVCTTVDTHNYLPIIKINFTQDRDTTLITSGKTNKSRTINVFEKKNFYKKNNLVKKVINIIKRLRQIFYNSEIDIEFAIDSNNKFHLLQARKIVLPKNKKIFNTNKLEKNFISLEKKIQKIKKIKYNLFGKTTFFGVMPDWNPAEIIGIKPKPLALSLYKNLITDSIWSKQRKNYGFKNVEPNQLMTTFYGTPYIDIRIDFNSWIPNNLDNKISEKLTNFYLNKFQRNKSLHDKIEFEILYTCLNFSTKKKLSRELNLIFSNKERQEILQNLSEITSKAITNFGEDKKLILELVDKQKKINNDKKIYPINKIFYLIEDCKKFGTLPFAGLARCGFIAIDIIDSLEREKIITSSEKNKFLSSIKNVSTIMQEDETKLTRTKFIEKYGHLRPDTYEITAKNYKEGFKLYFDKKNKKKLKRKKREFKFKTSQKEAISNFLKKLKIPITFDKFLKFLTESIFYREYSKFIFTKSIDLVFNNLIILGTKLSIKREDLLFLDLSTILSGHYNLQDSSFKKRLLKNISENKKNYYENSKIYLNPIICSASDLYYNEEIDDLGNFITEKKVEGRTYYLGKNFSNKKINNKIVFIENADPGYDFLFSKNIKGFVTKYGGQNSHMSIRSAELSIPACIGIGEKKFELMKQQKYIILDCKNKKIF